MVEDWQGQDAPWLSVKLRAMATVASAYQDVVAAVAEAVAEFLERAYKALLGAGENVPPDVAAWPGQQAWSRIVTVKLRPVVQDAYVQAHAAAAPGAEVPVPSAAEWLPGLLSTVTEAAFPALVLREVLDAVTESRDAGEAYPLLRARVADVLSVDALDRGKRHRLAVVRREQGKAGVSPQDHRDLSSRAETIAGSNDRPWQAQVRLMARRPVFLAVNTATYAGGLAWSRITGRAVFKRWISLWAIHDPDTRSSHRLALRQTRRIDEPYLVGAPVQSIPMRFPHDPRGPVEETVNCRCVQILLHDQD